jgi:hypothetical protein
MYLQVSNSGYYLSSCLLLKKEGVSEIETCLCLQVEATQLDPIDRASAPETALSIGSNSVSTTEYGDRIQSPKHSLLSKRQDDR